MNIERLIAMANDISHYFAAEPDKAAGAASVADHLKRFWEPGMRRQIVAHLHAGGEGLEPLTKVAIERLAQIDPKAMS
ncbi:formate dehydrogenase subunit delta [Dyella flava]|uniref:Formate dehydrogenase subunit delta n=1 Tax=Dyella flava TaxID=1920170 RepID=A0ABS2KB00_9GAMM|nr:formate dehydrogenase subunit delta [Dyella flava]MBM7127538.1 formate dehydrogenase subunit delta [Dyella flava]GLQ51137.1 NAD-dependent formate dehydrogenase subunit delta [Dyella flava]